jgi:hypothetical protein
MYQKLYIEGHMSGGFELSAMAAVRRGPEVGDDGYLGRDFRAVG